MTEPTSLAHPILIADNDPHFIEANFHNVKLVESRTIVVDSISASVEVLKNRAQPLSGIFVNPAIGSPIWLHILKTAHLHRPALPIFLIDSGAVPPLTEDELLHLGVQQIVPKPISYEELRILLHETEVGFQPYALRELAKRSEETIKLEDESHDPGFVPIRLEQIMASRKSFFDLYLQLSPRKFVKILRYGEALPEERLMNYIHQGVTHLFLKKEAQEHYLTFCDEVASRALSSEKAHPKLQTASTLNYGEQTVRFLEEHGVNHTSLKYARKYVEKVHNLIGKLAKTNGYLSELMKNVALYDHAASTAIVASLMVKEIGITAKPVLEASGMAVLLHDIGLIDSSEAVRSEDVSKMNRVEEIEYYTHPEKGAKMLSEFKEFPKSVIEAVQQHHYRPKPTGPAKGFPRRPSSKNASINRLAELIGVSDEFTMLIAKAMKDPSIDPLQVMENHVLKEFSDPVASAFRATFILNK